MKRSVPSAASRLLPGAVAFFFVVVLPTGWVGARAWYRAHHEEVTGRRDAERVSCMFCHRRVTAPPRGTPLGRLRYLSPTGMAVSPDGRRLFVAASGADRLLEVDLSKGQIARSVEIPGRPHGVAVSASGRYLAVTSRDGDEVHVLDTDRLATLKTVAAAEPLGVVLASDGAVLYVANGATDELSIQHLDGPESPVIRLVAGNEPYAVAVSVDRVVVVANRLVYPAPAGVLAGSEVTLVDPAEARVRDRRKLVSAHLSEGIVLSSDASFALAPIVHFRNLLPLTQVERGAVMNSALAFIETRPEGRTVQFPLDEVNAYFADPSGIALLPDDRLAFVAHSGANRVTVVDVQAIRELMAEKNEVELESLTNDMGVSARYVVGRISTGACPRTMVLSPDGARLYVAEYLSDTVAVIDTEKLRVIDRIDLGGPHALTAERRGERVFHDASVTFQGQFSCRSCHPDGHTDGLTWDFEIDGVGENVVETRSLRGIRDTAPFKWNGKNPDLATQCGPRFARVLTRSDPFTPEDLADLVAYIESVVLPPRRLPEEFHAARERGRILFFRTHTKTGEEIPVANRCHTCHRPPLFTNRMMTDVGTGGRFDTPHLLSISSSAPYLHDGRAVTLEEIWTVHSPDDSHGVTSDLAKAELNDLVNYLRSL